MRRVALDRGIAVDILAFRLGAAVECIGEVRGDGFSPRPVVERHELTAMRTRR